MVAKLSGRLPPRDSARLTRTILRVDSRDTDEEISMPDFAALLEQARSYARHSYAANTRAAYASDWQQFRA